MMTNWHWHSCDYEYFLSSAGAQVVIVRSSRQTLISFLLPTRPRVAESLYGHRRGERGCEIVGCGDVRALSLPQRRAVRQRAREPHLFVLQRVHGGLLPGGWPVKAAAESGLAQCEAIFLKH